MVRAGVVVKSDKVNVGDAPLEMVKDLSSFKLYMSDTGLFCNRAGITWDNINIFNATYLGGLIENYVATNLVSNGYELYYWESNGKAEIDFIINKDGFNIPVEVKKGEHSKSRSLEMFVKQYNPKYSIRISSKNFGFENNIKSVPLYAVHLI